MKDCGMHRFCKFAIVLALGGLLAVNVGADTLHLTDGSTVSGEVVTLDDKGVVLKQSDGNYSDHIPWSKLSQADLRSFQDNPKAAQYVEPWVELTQEDKAKRTEIVVKEVPHSQRPNRGSLLGAMVGSGMGVFLLLVLYAGNLYAAYEVSIFRGRSAGTVCGLAAVAPVIGPIIFLCLASPAASRLASKPPEEWRPPSEEFAEAAVAEVVATAEAPQAEAAAGAAAAEPGAPAPAAAPALPPTKSYLRGQYTFNRRFFETQMPGFFGVVRGGADKDMVLSIRSARGTHVGQRIQRITANELHLQVQKQSASEEVLIPFVEIQEVQLKHKDA
jgi:hypothetical protein